MLSSVCVCARGNVEQNSALIEQPRGKGLGGVFVG